MKRIALTLGDRHGIGPELVARRLADQAPEGSLIIVLGDSWVLARGACIAGQGTARGDGLSAAINLTARLA